MPAAVAVPAWLVAAPVLVPAPALVEVPGLEVVDVELELVVLVVELLGAAVVSPAEVGTVNGGAPATFGVVEPPPPQPARPTTSASAATATMR